MKSASTKTNTRSKTTASVLPAANLSGLGDDERLERIRTAAYYKAEARQFAPGQELDDWVQATVEHETIDTRG